MRYAIALLLAACSPALTPDAGMDSLADVRVPALDAAAGDAGHAGDPDANAGMVDAASPDAGPTMTQAEACHRFFEIQHDLCGGPALTFCPWTGEPADARVPTGCLDAMVTCADVRAGC